MSAKAIKMSKGQMVPIQLSEGIEDQDPSRSGADGELVSPDELPVSQQVETHTPVFPTVEENDLSSRDDHGSSLGQQNNSTNPLQQKSLPLGAKGNAAKISPAEDPRGESLAKFQATSEDAQNDMKQRETVEMVESKSLEQSDQLQMGTPSPFTTNESIIRFRGESSETVHSVVISLDHNKSLTLEHVHPIGKASLYKMIVEEAFKSSWRNVCP